MAGPGRREFDGGLIVASCFVSISLSVPFCFDHVSENHRNVRLQIPSIVQRDTNPAIAGIPVEVRPYDQARNETIRKKSKQTCNNAIRLTA
jgi:hypothetical protein